LDNKIGAKMKKLSEQQAWLTMARAYATPREERSELQRLLTRWGLCYSVKRLLDRRLISYQIENKMGNILVDSFSTYIYMLGVNGPYFCPLDLAGDLLRADFCYGMYYRCGGKREE